jgi:hypothetical protein
MFKIGDKVIVKKLLRVHGGTLVEINENSKSSLLRYKNEVGIINRIIKDKWFINEINFNKKNLGNGLAFANEELELYNKNRRLS